MKTQPPPSGVRSLPPPPPSSRFQLPVDTTIRSLECWSLHGQAGDRLSDAYAARAALAAGSRYGLNRFGRLIFVFLPGQGAIEHDIQSRSPRMTSPTLANDGVTATLCKMSR